MRVYKKKFGILFFLIIISVLFCKSASPQITKIYSEEIIERNVYLSEKDDIIIRGVFHDHDYWFTVPEFIKLEKATLVLNLSHAKELIHDLSTLTVSLNGAPLKSVFLIPLNSDNYKLSIDIPAGDLIIGFNQIRLSFFMRSTLVPCADIDNPINWLILHKDSLIKFQFRMDQKPAVGIFDGVFCKAGALFPDDIAFVLDNDSDDNLLTAASIISNFLGSASARPRNIKVLYKGDLSPDILSKYNIIVIGKVANFPLLEKLSNIPTLSNLSASASGLKEGQVLTFLARSAWANDKFIFGIMGLKQEDVKKGALYITREDISNTFDDIAIFDDITLTDVKLKPPKKRSNKISFEDLGYPNRTVRGVFSRETSFKLSRPYNWKLRPNSKLNLVMLYSSFIRSQTSAVDVEINGVPVSSKKLLGNPEKPFLMSVDIPRANLEDREFFVSTKFYLDIGQTDCNHLEKEKAWVAIKNNSNFYLPHGFKRRKDFSDFPSLLMREDNLAPTTIFVPDRPSQDILSVALTISTIVGSALPQEIISPEIKKASSFNGVSATDNIMLIGWPDDFSWYADLGEHFPIGFDREKGIFKIEENIPDISFKGNYAVMQMCPSPWNRMRTASILSAHNQGYEFLKGVFINPKIYKEVKGDFVYLPAADKVFSYSLGLKPQEQLEAWYIVIWAVIVILLLAVVIYIYTLIRRKKK